MPSHEHGCGWVLDRLDALIDDDFDATPEERDGLERHVASCDACARELALARTVREQLHGMRIGSAPTAVIARAEASIAAQPDSVIPLRPRRRLMRRLSVVAAAAVILAGLTVADQRRRAANELAVEQAARDAAIAFAYIGKYTRRAGDIVESEVIEQRLLAPVGKAMEKSGVTETKSSPSQS